MVARSGQPIDHWYWGKIVHDLSGVHHKGRIPIDYCHDDKEIIGYANHFGVEDGDLAVSGALVPYKDNDRASEVVHKFKAGVPYEASINFGGDGIEVENVPDGEETDVNGFKFSGPGVVVRQWPLRGVAVCPYGADGNTKTEFSNDEKIAVRFTDMDKQEKPEVVEVTPEKTELAQAVESEPEIDTAEVKAEVSEEQAEEPIAVEAEPVAAELSDREDGKRFLEKFGEAGAVWFVNGLTFDQARDEYEKKLQERIEELETKLAALPVGESEPASYSEAAPAQRKGLVPLRRT
jgi:hypothetical protein